MVVTGWKKALTKSGRSQRSLAKALSLNLLEVNLVAQGKAFLSPDKFKLACELLDCRPTDIYTEGTLAFMYGGPDVPAAEPQRKRRVRVELDEDSIERVDALAQDERLTRSQAANAIIRRAFETRRIVEHV